MFYKMHNNLIYTIGHLVHAIEHFIELLKKYNINCLIDVRSYSLSKIAPQFNKDDLAETLKKNNRCSSE